MPRVFPELVVSVRISDGLYGLIRGGRLWNQHSRVAMRETLEEHHRKRIPLHFRLGARSKYGYQPRKYSTEHKKERYWRKPGSLDLVRSGSDSRSLIENYTVKFSGAFGGEGSGGTLQGRLVMKHGHPFYRGKKYGIQIDQIDREITATTNEEDQEIGNKFRDTLVDRINNYHGPMRRFYTGNRG